MCLSKLGQKTPNKHFSISHLKNLKVVWILFCLASSTSNRQTWAMLWESPFVRVLKLLRGGSTSCSLWGTLGNLGNWFANWSTSAFHFFKLAGSSKFSYGDIFFQLGDSDLILFQAGLVRRDSHAPVMAGSKVHWLVVRNRRLNRGLTMFHRWKFKILFDILDV